MSLIRAGTLAIILMICSFANGANRSTKALWVEAEDLLPQLGFRSYFHPHYSKGISGKAAEMSVDADFRFVLSVTKPSKQKVDVWVKAYSKYKGSKLALKLDNYSGKYVDLYRPRGNHFQWHCVAKNLRLIPKRYKVTLLHKGGQILDVILIVPSGVTPTGNRLSNGIKFPGIKIEKPKLGKSIILVGRSTYHLFPDGITRLAYNSYHNLDYEYIPTGENIEFVAELPAGLELIEVASTLGELSPQVIPSKQKTIYRVILPEGMHLNPGRAEPQVTRDFVFYIKKTYQGLETKRAKFYFIYNTHRQPAKKVLLKPIKVQKVIHKPQWLLCGFADQNPCMNAGFERQYLQRCNDAGLNFLVVWHPYHDWPLEKGWFCTDAAEKFVKLSKEMGITLFLNYSPFWNAWPEVRKRTGGKPSGRNIDGKPEGMCPSLRGLKNVLQESMDKDISAAVKHGIKAFTFDQELFDRPWSSRICFCDRCIEGFRKYLIERYPKMKWIDPKRFERHPDAFPKYHRIWCEYRMNLMTELWYKRFVYTVANHLGLKDISSLRDRIIFFTASASHIRSVKSAQWDTLNNFSAIGKFAIVAPMAYLNADLTRIATIKNISAALPGRLIMGLNCRDEKLSDAIIEAVIHGSRGFFTWYSNDPDAKTFSDIAYALNLLVPYENIFETGQHISQMKRSPNSIYSHMVCTEKSAILFVSNDIGRQITRVEITLPTPGQWQIKSLTDKRIRCRVISNAKAILRGKLIGRQLFLLKRK